VRDHNHKVHGIFTRIADKYDWMNTILSLNLDKQWRYETLELAKPVSGECWLDVCCGTGKLTLGLRRRMGCEGEVTGLDFNAAMLTVAKINEMKEPCAGSIHWVEADATQLPFSDEVFDGVIIGFGLRNLPDIDSAIHEMRRVLKPGGRLVCLDLSHPVLPFVRQGHRFFVRSLVPLAGKLIQRGEQDYQWLPDSLKQFPGAEELAEHMKRNEMHEVFFQRLSGGIAAVHKAIR
jgi:demethylmenaquinone methyltransferase/2-methoxy-6-polyprenyl-1,4-benzoquinol methylase